LLVNQQEQSLLSLTAEEDINRMTVAASKKTGKKRKHW